MDKILLSINTDDPDFSNAAQKYWLVDETGKFVYLIRDIAKELGVSQQTLTALIRQQTTAVATDNHVIRVVGFIP